MTNSDRKLLCAKLLAAARWIVKWTKKANPRAKLPRYIVVSRLSTGRTWVHVGAAPKLKMYKWQKLIEPVPDIPEIDYRTDGTPIASIVYDTERDHATDEWVTQQWRYMDEVPGVGTFAWSELLERLPWAP